MPKRKQIIFLVNFAEKNYWVSSPAISMATKNYWQGRDAQYSLKAKFQNLVQRSAVLNNVFTFFTSNRTAEQNYLMKKMRTIKPNTTIDVACGWGKQVIVKHSDYVIGADIKGYPKEIAKRKGYDEVLEYTETDHTITPSRNNIDLITCINLNAHLPFEAFKDIIDNVLPYCKKDVQWLLINEYDNNALSYKKFNADKESKDRLVNGMEHYFFSTEKEFMDKMRLAFPDFEVMDRTPLIAQVTAVQHYVFKHKKNPSGITSHLLTLKDVFLSMYNSFYTKTHPDTEGFLVGHMLRRKEIA